MDAVRFFGFQLPVAFFVVSLVWSVVTYILLLNGISKWAARWGRSSASWVLIGVFFSPIVAAALLLMYGNNVSDTKYLATKVSEYKHYWHAQIAEVISVIKDRLPLQAGTTKTEPQIDVEGSLEEDPNSL